MLRNKVKRQAVTSVDASKAVIKYSITLTGSLDWNDNFADRGIRGEDPTIIDNYAFAGADSFKQSLVNYLWSRIEDQSKYLFEECQLASLELSDEVQAAYFEYKANLNDLHKEKLKAELQAAEKRAAELRAKLG